MTLADNLIVSASVGERRLGRDIPPAVLRIEDARKSLVRPLFILSTAFYVLGLVVLAYFPDVATLKVTGAINVAYVLALLQFVMTFAVAYVYARRANRLIDPLVAEAFASVAKTHATGGAP